jgi:regulator of replication initiation timing
MWRSIIKEKTMNAIQLEFNLDNESENEIRFSMMQKQINEMSDSMGKVRRKLFSEMSECKRLYVEIKQENEKLKRDLKNQKTEWVYLQNDLLVDVKSN